MAKKFFAPIRMESQFNSAKLFTVMYTAGGEEASAEDGALVALGAFANDPVYTAAWTAAAGSSTEVVDINTRIAAAPAAATATGLCILDLANVPTATNGSLVYRVGSSTIGLTAAAGVPVRARKLCVDDTFMVGVDNFDTAPTVGKWATATASDTIFTSKTDAAPSSGLSCLIVDKQSISEGADAGTDAYRLLVLAN